MSAIEKVRRNLSIHPSARYTRHLPAHFSTLYKSALWISNAHSGPTYEYRYDVRLRTLCHPFRREDAARGADERVEGRRTHNQVMPHDVDGSAPTNIETHRPYSANRRIYGGWFCSGCVYTGWPAFNSRPPSLSQPWANLWTIQLSSGGLTRKRTGRARSVSLELSAKIRYHSLLITQKRYWSLQSKDEIFSYIIESIFNLTLIELVSTQMMLASL